MLQNNLNSKVNCVLPNLAEKIGACEPFFGIVSLPGGEANAEVRRRLLLQRREAADRGLLDSTAFLLSRVVRGRNLPNLANFSRIGRIYHKTF